MTDRDLTRAEVEAHLEYLADKNPHKVGVHFGPHHRVTTQLLRCMDERERLALAICGGEDAPGYANAQTVDALEKVAWQNAESHIVAIGGLQAAEAENARLREALTPSGDTKAAYSGEFSISVYDCEDNQGNEIWRQVLVDWATIKAIMAAIKARAALPAVQTFTAADLEAACRVGFEMVAQLVSGSAYTSNGDKRSLERVAVGLDGMDQHHATIATAARALSPPADLVAQVKEARK